MFVHWRRSNGPATYIMLMPSSALADLMTQIKAKRDAKCPCFRQWPPML